MNTTSADTRTTAQIYEEAANVNDQVTDGLRNALRIVDDTRDVQATTLTELQKQGEQLGEIQETLDDVQEDTKYAQAVLDDIGCLCWCFGGKKSNKLQRPVHPPKYRPETKSSTTKPAEVQMTRNETKEQTTLTGEGPGSKNKGSSDDSVLKRIEDGKKDQDVLFDQISQGLDVLSQGAKAMGEELAAQDAIIDATEKQTDDATQDTKNTARHAAFRRHLR